MVYLAEIKDSKHGVLSVTLLDVLKCLGNRGEELYWSIHYLYATGNLGKGKSILDLENQINDSPTGMVISWKDLTKLAGKFDQVIDTVIVGNKSFKNVMKANNDKDAYRKNDIVLDLFDGAYWRVSSQDKRIFKAFEEKFSEVEIKDVNELA
ncbi:MAG: hypothetical protein WB791_02005 [Waddliaceae bacterium]